MLAYLDAVELKPRLHLTEFAGQVRDHLASLLPMLQVRAPYHQEAARVIGFEVAARDEGIAEQERAHVIAVDPFGRRHIHLDPVLHPEEALHAIAFPNE